MPESMPFCAEYGRSGRLPIPSDLTHKRPSLLFLNLTRKSVNIVCIENKLKLRKVALLSDTSTSVGYETALALARRGYVT